MIAGLVASRGNWSGHLRFPVLFDEILEVFPIGGTGIGDVVVGEPTLELGLVPFVVRCT